MLGFLILVISSILVIFLIGVIVFLFTNKKNRVSNAEEQLNENIKLIENQRTIWMRKTKRSVEITPFKYYENFASFPFLTDFENTKNFLIKNKVSFKAIDSFIFEMKEIQDKIFNEFRIQQKNLLRQFDQTNIQDTPSNREFLMKYYIKNLDNFMTIMTNGFVRMILDRKINFLLGADNFNEKTIVDKLIYQLKQNTISLIENLINQAKTRRKNEHQDMFTGQGRYHNANQQKHHQFNQHKWNNQQQTNKNQNSSNWQEFDDESWAYKTLGLDKTASFEEVKKQYKKLAMQYHPDRNKEINAKNKMVEINQAYDYIKKINNK